jgi:hypothetical protein
MKQNIKTAAIIISIVFALSGCGTANTAANEASTPNQANQPASDGQNVQNPPDGQAGQNNPGMQLQDADLMGEVSAISGNEITVKVISIPQMGQGQKGGPDGNSNGQTSRGAIGRKQAPAAGDGQASANDAGKNQAPADGTGQNRASADNAANGQQPQREIQYTGETKVLKLTDSVTITETVREDKNVTSQAIKLTDIKVGDTLQVYYSDKSKETISKIILGSGWGMGGGRQQGQQPDSNKKS